MSKCTDNLTLGEIKELMAIFSQPSQQRDDSHWKVGEAYLIRTVTMILIGRLEKVTKKEFVLSSASWIADTGRFHDAITKGKLKEVEPYGDKEVIVGRGSLIDATIWTHSVPREQK
jgi:hypothetical protein